MILKLTAIKCQDLLRTDPGSVTVEEPSGHP